MDDFDDFPCSLMFLNNEIQNEETTAYHGSVTIFPSHEHILVQAKAAISQNWVLIDNKYIVHVICNPKLLYNILRTD